MTALVSAFRQWSRKDTRRWGSAARSRTTAGPTDHLGRYAGEVTRRKSSEDFSLIPQRVLYDPSRRDGIGRPIGEEDLRMDGDGSGSGCNGEGSS